MNNRGLAAFAAAACLLAGAWPAGLSAQQQQTAPWINVHSHLIGRANPGSEQNYPAAVSVLLQAMDQVGIRTSIVMPPPTPSPGYDENAVLAAAKKYPDRIFYMGGGNSLMQILLLKADETTMDDATRRQFTAMAEAILDSGAIGFGEMAAHHIAHLNQHPYERIQPDHPLFLLLVDIAARRNVPIDLHLDPIVEPTPPLSHVKSVNNPSIFVSNIAAFERLLAHNRGARIVWAHAGWDQTGQWTTHLTRRLLAAHPNLFMSLKTQPRSTFPNHLMDKDGRLQSEWRSVIEAFPDRFVLGSDTFHAAPGAQGGASAGSVFSEKASVLLGGSLQLLAQLPVPVARKIAVENTGRIYGLPVPALGADPRWNSAPPAGATGPGTGAAQQGGKGKKK